MSIIGAPCCGKYVGIGMNENPDTLIIWGNSLVFLSIPPLSFI